MNANRISPNYFSIEDILTTQESVPCQLSVPLLRLGYLDSSSESENLASGKKMELPFWLAQALTRRRNILTCDLPKMYKLGYREILNADPSVIDLHKLGPFFYMLGIALLSLDYPEKHDVADCLLEAFKNRFKLMMDASQSTTTLDTIQFMDRLDEFERVSFLAGRQCLQNHQHWENRDDKILMSNIIKNKMKTDT